MISYLERNCVFQDAGVCLVAILWYSFHRCRDSVNEGGQHQPRVSWNGESKQVLTATVLNPVLASWSVFFLLLCPGKGAEIQECQI